MIDPTLFGLQPETEVKFFTPEEAANTVGAKAGYNAVHRIGENRMWYELIKAGKYLPGEEPVAVVKEEKPVEVVVQEDITPPVIEPVTEETATETTTEQKEEVKEVPVTETEEKPVDTPVKSGKKRA